MGRTKNYRFGKKCRMFASARRMPHNKNIKKYNRQNQQENEDKNNAKVKEKITRAENKKLNDGVTECNDNFQLNTHEICENDNENNTEVELCNFNLNNKKSFTSNVISHEVGDNNIIVENITEEHELPASIVNSDKTEDKYEVHGRRIVDINLIFNSMKEFQHCDLFSCSLQNVNIVNEQRVGLISKFFMKCDMCKSEKIVYTDDENVNRFDINKAAVLGTISTGNGYAQLDEFLAICDIPSLSHHTYINHEAEIGTYIRDAATKIIETAGKEEYNLAVESGNVDSNGTPLISVIADGAWCKRSYKTNYDAASGVGVIVGQRTGKILYLGIRNKYCCVCARSNNKNKEPPAHKCFKNWNKTSTSMESDILVEGFLQSMTMHGLIYESLIGDGDNSVTAKLLEARPYGTKIVRKIECCNHLLRNMCNKLKDLTHKRISNARKAVEYKQRNHLNNCIKRFRMAIQCAVKHYRNSTCTYTHEEKIKKLKKDIMNSPYHIFGLHDACDSYFCNGSKHGEYNWIPEMKKSGLFDDIILIISRVARNADSLILNMNTNTAERYNSVVAKFVGGKRINYSSKGSYDLRCQAAAVSYNVNSYMYPRHIIKTISGISPSKYTKKYVQKKAILYNWHKSRRSLFPEKYKKRNIETVQADVDYGVQVDADKEMTKEDYLTKCEAFLNNLKKSAEEIQRIQLKTIGQSSSSEWLEERSKRLTASFFGRICKMRHTTKCHNIVKELLYTKFTGNDKTRRGLEHEILAKKKYEEMYDIKIQECGLFIDEEHPFLGATPDGLIGDNGIVEIKCPHSCKLLSPLQAIQDKKLNCVELVDNKMKLKENHNYFYQVQGQLHITKRKYCIFIIWTPFGMETDIIQKDDNFWNNKLFPVLYTFYHKCLLPEIIDPRFPKHMPIRDLRFETH